MTPRPRKADHYPHRGLPAQFRLCRQCDRFRQDFYKKFGDSLSANAYEIADLVDSDQSSCGFHPCLSHHVLCAFLLCARQIVLIRQSSFRFPSGAASTRRIEAGCFRSPSECRPRFLYRGNDGGWYRGRLCGKPWQRGSLTCALCGRGGNHATDLCFPIPVRTAHTRDLKGRAVCGEQRSCWTNYPITHGRQFRRWQTVADSGRILPNPCGSQLCAESFGARTLRRNWSSGPAAATERVAPGRQVIARRRSTFFSCCCKTRNAGRQSLSTSCWAARRRGGVTINAH
jgi:hypothetical protein